MKIDKVNQSSEAMLEPQQNSVMYGAYLIFALFAVVLPNGLLEGVSNSYLLFRPAVNFDYIVAAILAVAGYRVLAVGLLVFFITVDIFSIISQVFPAVLNITELIGLARFIFLASWEYQAGILLMLVYTSAMAYLFVVLGRYGELKSGLVISNIILGFYLYPIFFEKGAINAPYVWSQTVNYFDYRSVYNDDTLTQLNKMDYVGDNAAWARAAVDEFSDRTLLIVNESWGSNTDPAVNEKLLRPLLEKKNSVTNLKSGEVGFIGSTLAAELKELCSLWATTSSLRNVKEGFENCLPNRLKNTGYSTLSLHAASKDMYDRKYWYPRAGFERQIFYESNQWPAKCVSWQGACDLDLREEVVKFFGTPGKKFVYWLTLNTHAFYEKSDLRMDVFDCESSGIDPESSTCDYLKLQAQFFYGLAEMVDDPRMYGVTVRVIGDHAPPIRNRKEKSDYFKKNIVSWLEFTIPQRQVSVVDERAR